MKVEQKKIILLFACLLLAIFGFFGLSYIAGDTTKSNSNIILTENAGDIILKENIDDAQMDKAQVIKPADDYLNYKISSGVVSYSIKKILAPSQFITVKGITSTVAGEGFVSKDYSEYYIATDVDLGALKTDNSDLDKTIINLFNEKVATIVIKSENNSKLNVKNSIAEQSIDGTININNVQKVISIKFKVIFGETGVDIQGSFSIKPSDFNINVTSLSSIFGIEDKAEINFKLKALLN